MTNHSALKIDDGVAAFDAFSGELGQRLYELAFQTTPVGMSFVTLDRRAVRCNPALCAFLGRSAEELQSTDISAVTHPEDMDLHADAHQQLLAGEIDSYRLDKRYLHKDGHVLWAHLQVGVIRDEDGAPRVLLSQVIDIGERKAQTERLRWRAEHDALTGTVNRTELFARLRSALQRAQPSRPVAVMYLDIDGFKQVNDRHGHATGDRVLQQAALRMARMLRASDTTARIGGDEFVLVAEDLPDAVQAGALADRILAALRGGVDVQGQAIDLSASIGIVLAHEGDPDSLLQRADAALYEAKRAGKDRYVIAA